MTILKNLEVHWVKLHPDYPAAAFGDSGPKWEMKIRTKDKAQKAEWEALGVKLPAFDHEAMTAKTKEHPVWVHFGAGNIFRGFIAALQQRLLNEGVRA